MVSIFCNFVWLICLNGLPNNFIGRTTRGCRPDHFHLQSILCLLWSVHLYQRCSFPEHNHRYRSDYCLRTDPFNTTNRPNSFSLRFLGVLWAYGSHVDAKCCPWWLPSRNQCRICRQPCNFTWFRCGVLQPHWHELPSLERYSWRACHESDEQHG